MPIVNNKISYDPDNLWLKNAATTNKQSLAKFSAPMATAKGFTKGAFHTDQTLLRSNAKLPGLPAPSTIFYSGDVHVYHNVSPEKAEAIMAMAGTGSCVTRGESGGNKPNISPTAQGITMNGVQPPTCTAEAAPIAMARRATVARFLAKRRDRIRVIRPYDFTEKPQDLLLPTGM
ncbi:hypothetical protein RJ639_039675 [Escallonia herrerae]|uniref:Protein TIFY n=1 Tax=Escallonia herrerae TaxID=1293975 RepID=A0AA88WQ23_9ASTE|nr:hypothetical protein RJ639_039675 [Escallonia herrerae]